MSANTKPDNKMHNSFIYFKTNQLSLQISYKYDFFL